MYSWTPFAGEAPRSLDAQRLRLALGAFPTGVCLVTTVAPDGKREGMTINSFASVSLAPPLVLWSIRDEARSADVFVASRHFVISVLAEQHRELAGHFARPAADKFAKFDELFEPGIAGCPRLRDAAATFECVTYSRHEEGDHTILVGRVEEFGLQPTQPLLFHSGQLGSIFDLARALAPGAG